MLGIIGAAVGIAKATGLDKKIGDLFKKDDKPKDTAKSSGDGSSANSDTFTAYKDGLKDGIKMRETV
jgi:hypothetical protein